MKRQGWTATDWMYLALVLLNGFFWFVNDSLTACVSAWALLILWKLEDRA